MRTLTAIKPEAAAALILTRSRQHYMDWVWTN